MMQDDIFLPNITLKQTLQASSTGAGKPLMSSHILEQVQIKRAGNLMDLSPSKGHMREKHGENLRGGVRRPGALNAPLGFWNLMYSLVYSFCAKSLQGEAPCASAVYGKVDEISSTPPPSTPSPTPLPCPNPPPQDPLPLEPPVDSMTCGRQGGQGRIDDITGKGLRTAVALSTASYFSLQRT